MFALIKNNNCVYYSVVLACINKGWSSSVVAFDDTLTRLRIIPFWDLHIIKEAKRNVYIFDNITEGWLEKRDIFGISQIVEERKTLRLIKHNKCPEHILNYAMEMQQSFIVKDSYPIANKNDASSFYELTMWLHDAYIVGIVDNSTDKTLYIDTTWQCLIIMKCYDVIFCENILIGETIDDNEDCFDFSTNDSVDFKPSFIIYDAYSEKIEQSKITCKSITYNFVVDKAEIEKIKKTF